MSETTTKTCNKCKQDKPLAKFYINRAAKDGKTRHCKDCWKAYRKRYYEANKERLREIHNEANRLYRLKVRKEVLQHYGGKCQCCGEERYEYLTFDHVNGGGNEHRQTLTNKRMAEWLRKNNYPTGFRVLCWNCNASYGYHGYSPACCERKNAKANA